MKFKDGAIKPGMVIHCPTEEDARALLEHLDSLGYKWRDSDSLLNKTMHTKYGYQTCYRVASDSHRVEFDKFDFFVENNYEIAEFSDLIEPDTPEMSAVEVLEWFGKYYCDREEMVKTFGINGNMPKLVELYGAQGVIDKITTYEAAKQKPLELEWVIMCRIIQVTENGFKRCVYEEEIPKDTADCLGCAEDILKRYIVEYDGEYKHIAVLEDVCRVKGD